MAETKGDIRYGTPAPRWILVPGSLDSIGSAFHDSDRGRAIGAWSGLAGIASAIGPFAGGWLIDAFSWRWVFLINIPTAIAAVVITVRHVPESRAEIRQPLDVIGAILAAVGLATLCWSLIESAHGFLPPGRDRGAATRPPDPVLRPARRRGRDRRAQWC